MQVVASSETGKSKKIYHKVNCMYAKRIKFDNRIDMNPTTAKKRHFCECKYCGGLKGDVRTSKKWILSWEEGNNIKFTYQDKTDTLYIQTEIGFWKLFRKQDNGKYLLYHRNAYKKEMSIAEASHGDFHRQCDMKATETMASLVEYIIAHDKAKVIIMEDYHKLPKQSKKQKKYYKQAERRVKKHEARRVDSLFAMLESDNPKLQEVIFC